MKNIVLQKRQAFSLAEVLITLGIIGVVASLTMPTLVSNHKKAVLKSQFKKAFSSVSQAYDAAAGSLGYYPNCYYWEVGTAHHCVEYGADNECSKYVIDSTGEEIYDGINGPRERCKPLADALETSLKIVKKCDGNAYADGCIPKYEGLDSLKAADNEDLTQAELTQMTTDCSGFRQNNILNKSKVYVLADGSIYITYGTDDYYKYPLFLLDVNGKKGPNKWGHDLFALELEGSIGKEFYVGHNTGCFAIEEGGTTAREMLLDK